MSKSGRYECPVCGSRVNEMPLHATLTDGDRMAIEVKLLEMQCNRKRWPDMWARLERLHEWADAYREAEEAKVHNG